MRRNDRLMELIRPRTFIFTLWLVRLTRFMTVGATGLVINTVVFVVATVLGLSYLLAALLGMQIATAWNFLLTERFVFPVSPQSNLLMRAGGFFLLANSGFAFGGPLLIMLVHFLGMPPVGANIVSVAAIFLVRFVIAERFIWRSPGGAHPVVPVAKG